MHKIALCGLLAAIIAAPAHGAPFTVETLLDLEGVGAASVAPGGRWAAVEIKAAYRSAPRFDYAHFNDRQVSRVHRIDLATGEAAAMLDDPAIRGVTHGPWSPAGDRLIVHQLYDETWRMGIVEAETGRTLWLGGSPELPVRMETAVWLSDDSLAVIFRDDDAQPAHMRIAWAFAQILPERWRATAQGEAPSATVFGSGRWRNVGLSPTRNRIERIDVRTGAREVLARGPFLGLSASPDGDRLAVWSRGEALSIAVDRPLIQGEPDRRGRLVLLDLNTGERHEALASIDVRAAPPAWRADGDALLVHGRSLDGDWGDGELFRVDARQGRSEAVDLGPYRAAVMRTFTGAPFVAALWSHDDPVIYAERDGRRDWITLKPEGPINLTQGLPSAPAALVGLWASDPILAAEGALWRLMTAGPERLTPAERPVTPAPTPIPSAGFPPLWSAPLADAPVAVVDAEGRFQVLSAEGGQTAIDPGSGRLLAASASGALRLDRDDRGVSTLWSEAPGRQPAAVHVINAQLATIASSPGEAVHHRSPSGQALTSWLYRPTGDDPAPAPLVVLAYPGGVVGPHPPDQRSHNTSIQVLAGAGFAVLTPDLPISPGAVGVQNEFTDGVLRAVEAALATGGLDDRRIALWGNSFGGHSALLAATRTDRFGAVIASASASDYGAKWGAFHPVLRLDPDMGSSLPAIAGWAETGQGRFGGAPWQAASAYVAASPLYDADQIETPLLLIHGDQDYVPLSQAESTFSAMLRQNRDAALVIYWGEGHAISSPANLRDMYARIIDWLETHLSSTP